MRVSEALGFISLTANQDHGLLSMANMDLSSVFPSFATSCRPASSVGGILLPSCSWRD
jgi:hypothetical protein